VTEDLGTRRFAGVLTTLVAVSALGIAYFVQYVLLLEPCELCLWERWPYRAAAVLGLLAAAVPRAAKLILALAGLVMLGGASIAFVHVGVEQGYWNSPLPECNGILTPGAALPAVPSIPCDRAVFLIPHLPVSMAAMDLYAALIFAFALLIYALRIPRRAA
jgi:disulfide bond formation protein DsbB